MGTFQAASSVWSSARIGAEKANRLQRARLAALLAYARRHSAFYQRHYRGVPPAESDLRAYPPVTRPELMQSFGEWVTDPAITRRRVDAFIADETTIGRSFLGRYSVWTTSGTTTGSPAILIQDAYSAAVCSNLLLARGFFNWFDASRARAFRRMGFKVVFVVATGGHFTAAAAWESIRHRVPFVGDRWQTLSLLSPLPDLVARLNDLQPAIVVSYPSALDLLAAEKAAGRLHICPVFFMSTSETLDEAARQRILSAFPGADLGNLYGASEFVTLGISCPHGRLHLNPDWSVLEPVDQDYRPVEPGAPSYTVLLTNLANRVQPVIRYDLGDSILLYPDPCPCGNPLPSICVEGRTEELLVFPGAGGAVRLLPMALATVVELIPGVQRYQIIQNGPASLSIRVEISPGWDEGQVWAAVLDRMQKYLAGQGLNHISVLKDPQAPHPDPVSGKFRHVWTVKESPEEPLAAK